MGLERERELEGAGDEAPRRLGRSQRLGVRERPAVDGVARGEPHPLVRPRRLPIELVQKIYCGDPDPAGEREPQVRIALDLRSLCRLDQIRDVDFSALQHRDPRGGFRNALEDEALHRRHLAPVGLVRLHHQLDAGGVAHELVRAEPDGMLLEAVVPDLLDVLLRNDPAGAGRRRPVEGHEVGEGLVQHEADTIRIDDHDLADFLLEDLRSLRAQEAELHVLRGEGIAVVKLESLPELELVGPPIRGLGPRLGEARRHEIAGHRLHEGVVDRVEHPERGDLTRHLARIEPERRERHVERPAHLAFRLGLRRSGSRRRERQGQRTRECESPCTVHGPVLHWTGRNGR